MPQKLLAPIFLLVTLLSQSCMAPYQKVPAQMLTADKMSYALPGSKIEVTVVPDVFDGQRNQYFSRMENRQRVNLIGLRIKNLSTKKVHLPGGLLFKNEKGDILPPLTAAEAVQLLCEEDGDNAIVVTGSLRFLRWLGSLANQVRKYRIRQDFAMDLTRRYLQEHALGAGEEAFGFLALPLHPRSPFVIEVERLPSVLEVD